jgi:formylglycine-generating enzyme required for sulfatase activity
MLSVRILVDQLLGLAVCLICTNLSAQTSTSFTNYTEDTFALAIDMVGIKSGQVEMGKHEQEGRWEAALHLVTLDSFYMSKTEITQKQYLLFLNNSEVSSRGYLHGELCIDVRSSESSIRYNLSDSSFYIRGSDLLTSQNYPVNNVTWDGASEYCEWLSKITGKKYRLPTEAEWEYAAGGEKNKYQFAGGNDLDAVGWYSANSDDTLHPVGIKGGNSFGLYDMSGNVSEWCLDKNGTRDYGCDATNPLAINGPFRIDRGGHFSDDAEDCLVIERHWLPAITCRSEIGFRIVSSGDQETVFECNSSFSRGYDSRKGSSPLIQYDFGPIQTLSLGVERMKIYNNGFLLLHCHGPYAEVGISIDEDVPMLVSKVGYQYFFLTMIAARVNVINYTDFLHNQIGIRPEIGLSAFTLGTVAYGYTFSTARDDYFNISGSTLSARIQLMTFKTRIRRKPKLE